MLGCILLLGAAIPIVQEMTVPAPAPEYIPAHLHPSLHADIPSGEGEGSAPLYVENLIDPAGQKSVHASTLAPLGDGGVRAWWYGGTREGARDVAIYSARFDPASRSWGEPQVIMTPRKLAMQLQRPIRKLGNPTAVRDARGRIHLFFVSVSVGGWATSAINVMASEDDGETFGAARRLVTSPFFNLSTLVRGRPALHADLALALPAYHQFLGKFAEIVQIADDGQILSKNRLSWGREALQPELIPLAPKDALVFMRYAGQAPRRMLQSRTLDGGRTFSRPVRTTLPNADNSVAAGLLPDGPVFLVFNDAEAGRHVLALAVGSGEASDDWVRVHDFENAQDDPHREFSYPAILQMPDGHIHLAYTNDRKAIKHVLFNDVWIRQTLDRAGWTGQ